MAFEYHRDAVSRGQEIKQLVGILLNETKPLKVSQLNPHGKWYLNRTLLNMTKAKVLTVDRKSGKVGGNYYLYSLSNRNEGVKIWEASNPEQLYRRWVVSPPSRALPRQSYVASRTPTEHKVVVGRNNNTLEVKMASFARVYKALTILKEEGLLPED